MTKNFSFPLHCRFFFYLHIICQNFYRVSRKKQNVFNWKLWKLPSSENMCGSQGKEFHELLLKLVNGKMLNVVTEVL